MTVRKRFPAAIAAVLLLAAGPCAATFGQSEWPPRPVWSSLGAGASAPAAPRVAQAAEPTAPPPESASPEPAAPAGPVPEPPADVAPVPSELPTVDEIRGRLETLPADIDPVDRDRADTAYRRAMTFAKQLADLEAKQVAEERQAASAAAEADKVRAGKVELANRPEIDLGSDPVQLEASLAALTAEKTKTDGELKALDQAAASREAVKKTAAEKTAAAEAKRTDLTATLSRLAAATDPASAAEALAAKFELRVLDADNLARQLELARHAAEQAAGLYAARRELAEAKQARVDRVLAEIGERLAAVRTSQARREVEEASRDAREKAADPRIAEIAETNAELAETAQALVVVLNAITASDKAADDLLGEIKQEAEDTRARVRNIGLTQSLGLLLRRRRASLPVRLDEIRSDFQSQRAIGVGGLDESVVTLGLDDALTAWRLRAAAAATRTLEYELEDRRSELPAAADLIRDDQDPDGLPPARPRRELVAEAERLRAKRVEYLDGAAVNAEKLADALETLAEVEDSIATTAGGYRDFIEKRIIWIRSSEPLGPPAFLADGDTLAWLLSRENWLGTEKRAGLGRQWLRAAGRRPWLPLAGAAGVLLLFAIRRRTKPRIAALGREARRGGFRQFMPTVRAAAYTVLGAGPGPALLAAIAVVLPRGETTFLGFAEAVRSSLLAGAAFWYPLELLRLTCSRDGLAEGHLGWPSELTRSIRLSIAAMRLFVVPAVLVWELIRHADGYGGGTAWERVAFVTACLTFALMAHPFLSPRGEPARRTAWKLGGWLGRDSVRLTWLAAVVAPCVFAGLSLLGYHYTATRLALPVFGTLCLVEAAVLVAAVLLRAVRVLRRRLRVRQLLFARRQRRLEKHQGDPEHAPIDVPPDEPIDADRTSEQARRLILGAVTTAAALGLWGLWSGLVPAFQLEQEDLAAWEVYTVATTDETGGDGAAETESPDARPAGGGGEAAQTQASGASPGRVSVTYFDLAGALLVALLTGYAARNLPGLIEIAVLAPLPIDAASRYAVTRVVSYAVLFVGTISTAALLGISWGNVQWLAAALTVGLGFGLQEVFANFVSGLIILFERPIRVGDIVTLDGTTGIVSRIRIRATTITNWDKQEFIVPNKDFITGRLLNWTLTDSMNRIVINVGIAYGSDVTLARETIAKVCADNTHLLKDPAPLITMEGFGASSLDFVVRAYLPKLDDRLATIHELHRDIDLAFREAGIEIAFPQLDLRVRDFAPAVEARVTQNATPA